MTLFSFYLGESRSITFFASLSEGRMFGPEARGMFSSEAEGRGSGRSIDVSEPRIVTSVKSKK